MSNSIIRYDTATGHCLEKGMVIASESHEPVIVKKVHNATAVTVRPIRWYDRLRWAIQTFIKDFMRGLTQKIN